EGLLSKGPESWSVKTLNVKRYFITDALDDFIGCSNRAEGIFIANTLAELSSEFVLRANNQWIGASKFVEAFELFYKNGKKQEVINLVDKILDPYGGRLFDGFSMGKE